MTIFDYIKADSSKIYLPLQPSTNAANWSPNYFVIEAIHGRTQARIPNLANPTELLLQPAKIMVYKLVFAEVLPEMFGRTEQYNEIALQTTETQFIPAAFDSLLVTYDTILASADQVNLGLSLFSFRSEKLQGLTLTLDTQTLQNLIN